MSDPIIITAPTNSLPIIQALVQAMRAALDAATDPKISGVRNRIFEGFAAMNVPYPFIAYNVVYDPYLYTWGSAMHQMGVDIVVWGDNPVDARNTDQLLLNALQDASLEVGSGQTTLICRRIADLSSKDTDAEGKPVYAIGGTYEVWTDQLLPRTAE